MLVAKKVFWLAQDSYEDLEYKVDFMYQYLKIYSKVEQRKKEQAQKICQDAKVLREKVQNYGSEIDKLEKKLEQVDSALEHLKDIRKTETQVQEIEKTATKIQKGIEGS